MTPVRAIAGCVVLFFLNACSGPELPFAKEQPAEGVQAEMVRPPWEALVKAGPGAAKDLDMETLDGANAQSLPVDVPLRNTIEGPEKVQELTAEAAPPERPAKSKAKSGPTISSVAVPVLQGPGGAELTLAMRDILKQAGWPVIKSPRKDALTVTGRVKLSAPQGANQTVTLEWVVTTPDGKVLGNVKQSNDVPAGSLDKGWGESARFAAEGAAEGLFKLIERFR